MVVIGLDCENCKDYPYLTEKNIEEICRCCMMKVAIEELKQSLKETLLYKYTIKILDWLSNKLER